MLYLGLNKRYDHLLHHDFVFSRDPEAEFDFIYRRGEPAPDPTCYLAAPARTDPRVAPPGGEALYVLVHTPYIRPGQDWRQMFPRYRRVILDKLIRTAGLHDLEQRIVFEQALTPQDIHDRYRVLNGAIYGLASHGRFFGAFKPGNRSRHVGGLYLAGGAAHPGPGMPMVMMSGWIAADSLDQDIRSNRSRSPDHGRGGATAVMGRAHRRYLVHDALLALLCLAALPRRPPRRGHPARCRSSRTSVIVYSNHPSWWDPLVFVLLQRAALPWPDRLWPDGSPFAGALRRAEAHRRLRGGPRHARRRRPLPAGRVESCEPRHRALGHRRGRFTDPRRRPVRLRPGVAHLMRSRVSVVAIPLAIEFTVLERAHAGNPAALWLPAACDTDAGRGCLAGAADHP